MNDYLDTTFPYYPSDIRSTKPLGSVSLRQFIEAVSNPKEKVRQLFIDIQKAAEKGDIRLKNELKKGLYFFNPCINTDGKGRSYDNITSFTGFCQIDFDGIPDAADFRDWFFDRCKSCAVVGVSSSGYGIKAITRIPIVKTVNEYKEYFYGLGYYLEELKGYDISPQNPALPLYLFHDPDTKWRDNAIVSKVRGEKINSFKKFEGDIEPMDNVSPKDKKTVISRFKSGIAKIDDNAHPQLLGYSLVLWGCCAAGYLSEDECEVLIEECISENEYMSKDTKGYIRNAKNMRDRGMSAPIYDLYGYEN